MGIQQYMKKRSPVNNICTTVRVRLVASEGVLFYLRYQAAHFLSNSTAFSLSTVLS